MSGGAKVVNTRRGLVIADVSGKGIPASLIMAMCRSVLRSKAPGNPSPAQVLRRVVFRAALPGIVDTLRISMGWGWTYLVVVELVGATNGLGFQIEQAERYLNTPEIILGIIVIGVLGLLFDFSFKAIYAKAFPYMSRGAR